MSTPPKQQQPQVGYPHGYPPPTYGGYPPPTMHPAYSEPPVPGYPPYTQHTGGGDPNAPMQAAYSAPGGPQMQYQQYQHYHQYPPNGGGGGSTEMAELKKELEKQKMMNEMDMRARLAALEAAKNNQGPVIVSNNMQQQQQQQQVTAVPMENYCGPISLCIGLFLLPCICFCPIDQRPAAIVTVPVAYR